MPNIKIYSTPFCAYCKAAKEYLTERGFAYNDIDVAHNYEKSEEMIEKSGQMGVPVIDINGEIVIGFDRSAIDKALGLKHAV